MANQSTDLTLYCLVYSSSPNTAVTGTGTVWAHSQSTLGPKVLNKGRVISRANHRLIPTSLCSLLPQATKTCKHMLILKSIKYSVVSVRLLTWFLFNLVLIVLLNQGQKILVGTEPIMPNAFPFLVSCPRCDNIKYGTLKQEQPRCSIVQSET